MSHCSFARTEQTVFKHHSLLIQTYLKVKKTKKKIHTQNTLKMYIYKKEVKYKKIKSHFTTQVWKFQRKKKHEKKNKEKKIN